MRRPSGLALHGEELFVVDTETHRIQVFQQRTGRFLRQWGRQGTENGELYLPVAAAIVPRSAEQNEDEIFVLNPFPGRIEVFRLSDSQFVRGFTLSSLSLLSRGIAVSGDRIYVSRSVPNQIEILEKLDGKRMKLFGGFESKESAWNGDLHKLFVDQVGKELLVADAPSGCIKALDLTSGTLLREYGKNTKLREQLKGPAAVVLHGDEVIVCDTQNNRLMVYDHLSCRFLRTVEKLLTMLGQSEEPTSFSYPRDLAVNIHNQLFVCDTGNDRILLFG